MGTGSQALEISQNSINRGWRLNQQELEVKILNSVWTGFPWTCVCVCTHTTDSKCIFFLMYFRCLFLKLSLLWVTNLHPFEVIMLGTRNLSQAAEEQIKEKRRDGSPSCKEGKVKLHVAHFWTTCEDGTGFKLTIQHNLTGRLNCWDPEVWIPVTLAPHLTLGGLTDIGWHALSSTPDSHWRRDTNLNHHCRLSSLPLCSCRNQFP